MTRDLALLTVLLAVFLSGGFSALGGGGADSGAACIASSHDPPGASHKALQSHTLHKHEAGRPCMAEETHAISNRKSFPLYARLEQDPSHACSSPAPHQEKKKQHSFLENHRISANVQITARLQVFHLHLQTYLAPPDERDAPGRRSDDPRAGPGILSETPAERFA